MWQARGARPAVYENQIEVSIRVRIHSGNVLSKARSGITGFARRIRFGRSRIRLVAFRHGLSEHVAPSAGLVPGHRIRDDLQPLWIVLDRHELIDTFTQKNRRAAGSVFECAHSRSQKAPELCNCRKGHPGEPELNRRGICAREARPGRIRSHEIEQVSRSLGTPERSPIGYSEIT